MAWSPIEEIAQGMECTAVVLFGGIGSSTPTVSGFSEDCVLFVPGPEDVIGIQPGNIANSMQRIGHFEFLGIDCIPDDGRRNKLRCRRDDGYFDFPEQADGVPEDWPLTARGLPTLSELIACLPTPHAMGAAIYLLPPPYGASFSSENMGEPCPHCNRPFEPYVPLDGSRAVRRFIEDQQPLMTFHRHDGTDWSEKSIGRTKAVLLGDRPVVYDMFTRERVL
jgi:hypothetical protein